MSHVFKAAIIGLFSLCFILTSCSSEAPPRPKVRLLLDWLPNPNHVALYAGLERGIFEDHGIEIELVKLSDPNEGLPFVASGRAEMAIFYMPHSLRAASEGIPFKVIGSLVAAPLYGIMALADTDLHTVQDLHGKAVGNSVGAFWTNGILNFLTESNPITLQRLVQLQFDGSTALLSHQVDAVASICWNIEPVQLNHSGVPCRSLRSEDLKLPHYHELVFIANEDFLRENPDFAKSFRKAYAESVSYCQKNPNKSFDLYAHANPDKDGPTRRWEREAWLLTLPLLSTEEEQDEELWISFHNWMLEREMLFKPLSPSQLLL